MRLLAVSPHLDDAVFSAGGLLATRAAAGWAVTVVTCFTASVATPTGFALACQLDKGLPADADYMALRRAEDEAACAVLGAAALHLPLPEAPHRGYGSAAALFAGTRPDDRIADVVAARLATLVAHDPPDLVLGPLCLGDHVDHHAVRDALERVVPADRLLWWEDWPYRDRAPTPASPPVLVEPLTAEARRRRADACAAYATQLGFQFGGEAAMRRRLEGAPVERFHAATPPRRGDGREL